MFLPLFLGAILMLGGCATSESTSKMSRGKGGMNSHVNNPSLSLAEYLLKQPGILIQGSGSSARVLVRGVQSYNSTNQPLFVIDGTRVGRSFAQVQTAVSVSDIERIEVLKGNEASSRYGMQGSAGVIIIHTKTN